MRYARWLVPVLSLAIVLLLTLRTAGGARLGPGPLHPAHAARPEVDGGANCEACHRAGEGLAVTGCVQCHAAIGAQIDGGTGLHGAVPAAQLERCGTCHPEHHGDEAPLIAGHAFALAGIPRGETYDHRHVDFRLHGAHAQVDCTKCHIGADAVDPPPGGRFLGLSQECTECHDDAHRGAFGRDCESCHGQERPFPESPGFRHATFELRGSHQQVACAECHAAGSERDVAALQRSPLPARTCAQCHDDPHAAGAAGLRLAEAADCARCHEPTEWRAARPTAERHAELGFPLRGAHAAADCAACHGGGTVPARWRGAAPTVASCAVCHPDHPHTGALVAAATAALGPADGCADCHADADPSFAGAVLAPAQHAATGLELAVPHAGVACERCHTGGTWRERFPGRAASDCRACHTDAHGGQFDGEPRYAQCTACHDAARAHFVPHAFGVADHAATGMPLCGAHDAVACNACHRDVEQGVRRFAGTDARCAACHADVHRGRFDAADRPRTVGGREGCARCHDTRAFAPVAGDFDHGLWTGHELRAAHAELPCAACHAAGDGGPAAPRLGAAAGTRCDACHADRHAGQFRVQGSTDCARCHGERRWQDLHFDHQRDSRFPLDGLHRDLACARCHLTYATGTAAVVRYKPLGTACGDCHKLGEAGARDR